MDSGAFAGQYALGIDVGASSVKLAAVSLGEPGGVGAPEDAGSRGGFGNLGEPGGNGRVEGVGNPVGSGNPAAGSPREPEGVGSPAGPSPGNPAAVSPQLVWTAREAHLGDVAGTLHGMLGHLASTLGVRGCQGIVATGSGAGSLRSACCSVGVLEDVPAITRGVGLLAPEARSVMEIGGQNAHFVALEPGRAPEFAMNESCASGTGSFFEDQMSRLGMRIEDYSSMVSRAKSVPRLSGRCSVFAKTDIIHRQQEGMPVEDILMGLCYAMVRSYRATIVRELPVRSPVVLSGGVALNEGVVRAVGEVFGLGEDEVLVSEDLLFVQAAGAALEAADRVGGHGDVPGTRSEGAPLGRLVAALGRPGARPALPTLPPLSPTRACSGARPASDHAPAVRGSEPAAPPATAREGVAPSRGFDVLPASGREPGPDGLVAVTLGIDVGSTSTDLVLLDGRGRIVDALYLRTGGDAAKAVCEGLAELGGRAGSDVRVVSVATTGSGRERMGKLVGADVVRDEITAQAAAAAKADPGVDTVFEIGGQDSKFVSLRSGQVADFQMNKICAAGTGSFVEEQAARMGIPLDDFGPLALQSASPLDLGERCTVFVESAIADALAAGADKRDVAAGLCLSVVRNYLHRVVGTRRVGERIVLQGGVAYNPGIVAAFCASFGDRLTVSPWFAVSGAVGAALLAAEAAQAPGFAGTTFKGWDLAGAPAAGAVGTAAVAPVAAAEGTTAHAGAVPAVGTTTPSPVRAAGPIEANRAFYRKSAELFLAGYTGEREPGVPTVGIPRALLLHRLFPMANAFFRELGLNTYLTPESDDDIVRAAQESCQGEVCYPVKLVHGHMARLAEAGVDYVFMPRVRTIRHEGSRVRHNYACVYMQTAPVIAARALRFEERGIRLLSPVLDMDFGQAEMATAMLGVGAELGFSPERTAQAMLAGGFALTEHGERVERLGDELLASLGPRERVLVIVTRNYGIADPVLNMGIPELLLERGVRVITMGHLRGHDVDVADAYPELCWPFGQHILGSARIIREDPRLFAVYLTNHGCGPDTMLSHLFAEEMGDKPYLQIEVDEHVSKVGVITRLEAFLNALDHWEPGTSRARSTGKAPLPAGREGGSSRPVAPRISLGCDLRASRPVAVPDLGACAQAVAAWLGSRGLGVTLVPADRRALEAGRAEVTSKEYLTFTMLLGQAVLAADASLATQVLLPGTEGAEADGQYARVIAGVLARRGGAARVVAPALERLAWECPDVRGLFGAVLEGDVRQALADRDLLAGGAPGGGGLPAALPSARAARPLGIVGEWELVACDGLSGGIARLAAGEGFLPVRMPLAEYLWFLWNDDLSSERLARERDEGPCLAAEELEGRQELLDDLARTMRRAGEGLGEASPFSPDPSSLVASADEGLGRFAGGGGRYRLAKAVELGRRCAGVLTLSSMYENTDTILRLLRDRAGAPTLSLSFDGSPGQGAEERLRSFLYYL